MTEDVFGKLQKHLNNHPMGYPATENGVEIELLRKVFQEEEAAITLGITPKPVTAEELASKLGYDAEVMKEKLNQMAKKGLIFRKRKGKESFYHLEPWVVGIFEFQVGRMDKEFISLSEKYNDRYGEEFFSSETPYWKIIPVEKSVPTEFAIFPHEKVSEIIDKSEKIAVTDCICRATATTQGRGCGRTVQNCMILSSYAEYYIENGWPGRLISKEEAFEILDQTEEEGLVHSTQNAAKGNWFLCNCCSCCCGVLMAVKNFNLHSKVARTYYFAEVDESSCSACEDCVERCQFSAISVNEELAQINRDLCVGCGLCVSSCSTGALSLTRKPEDQIVQPPSDVTTMLNQIGKEKGRTMKVAIE